MRRRRRRTALSKATRVGPCAGSHARTPTAAAVVVVAGDDEA
jgi:hypothetical protein